MQTCINCNLPLKRQPNGMLKCGICGVYYRPNQSTPLLGIYASENSLASKSQGDQDLEIYIERLVRKLVPIYKEYGNDVKPTLYHNRELIKEKFAKVMDGKMGLKKWFDWLHTNSNKHPVDLAKILVECTEGLNSVEIKELRQGAENFHKYMAEMYNAGAAVV